MLFAPEFEAGVSAIPPPWHIWDKLYLASNARAERRGNALVWLTAYPKIFLNLYENITMWRPVVKAPHSFLLFNYAKSKTVCKPWTLNLESAN